MGVSGAGDLAWRFRQVAQIATQWWVGRGHGFGTARRTRMARIALRPSSVAVVDFRTRQPSALGGVEP